jgi:hypothetical protein
MINIEKQTKPKGVSKKKYDLYQKYIIDGKIPKNYVTFYNSLNIE